jgi:hypothetical protein
VVHLDGDGSRSRGDRLRPSAARHDELRAGPLRTHPARSAASPARRRDDDVHLDVAPCDDARRRQPSLGTRSPAPSATNGPMDGPTARDLPRPLRVFTRGSASEFAEPWARLALLFAPEPEQQALPGESQRAAMLARPSRTTEPDRRHRGLLRNPSVDRLQRDLEERGHVGRRQILGLHDGRAGRASRRGHAVTRPPPGPATRGASD